MTAVVSASHAHEEAATFGVVLTLCALAGPGCRLARRGSGQLALLWLGSALLALRQALTVAGRGCVPFPVTWHGIRVLPSDALYLG